MTYSAGTLMGLSQVLMALMVGCVSKLQEMHAGIHNVDFGLSWTIV